MDTKNEKRSILYKILDRYGDLSQEKYSVLIIVLVYALISELWILLSDKLFIEIFNIFHLGTPDIMLINIIKGTIYVVISSKLLFIFINKNILAIKGLKSHLKESEDRYSTLVKLLPDAVTIVQDGKLIFTNDAGAKLFSVHNSKDLLGTPIKDIIREEHTETYETALNLSEEHTKTPDLFEKIYTLNDGSNMYLEITSCDFNYDGQPSTLNVLRDVTTRKITEQKLNETLETNKILLNQMMETDKVKTEFFCNLSHEFKTPLNIIFGIVQIMNSNNTKDEFKLKPEKTNQYIKLMKQNCYRLLRLINNLIDISKIEAGYLEMDFKTYNIINIVENISLSVADFADSKGISIVFDTEVEEKLMLCDANYLERIMLNLLSNAIKYSKAESYIYVNIFDNKDTITISIKDTGIGIPKDKLPGIFDRFVQVDSSLQREHEGSGIGLALVKSLVEKHGGEISVKSTVNVGTEFLIHLPVTVAPGEHKELNEHSFSESLVEKIHIEFSDIYS